MKCFTLICLLFAIVNVSYGQQKKPSPKSSTPQQKVSTSTVTIASLSRKIAELSEQYEQQQQKIAVLQEKLGDLKDDLQRRVDHLEVAVERIKDGGGISTYEGRSLESMWDKIEKLSKATDDLKQDIDKLKRN